MSKDDLMVAYGHLNNGIQKMTLVNRIKATMLKAKAVVDEAVVEAEVPATAVKEVVVEAEVPATVVKEVVVEAEAPATVVKEVVVEAEDLSTMSTDQSANKV